MTKPIYSKEHSAPPNTASVRMSIAFKILTNFPHRAPSVAELMSLYGMSRATAFRWRRALTDARGM